MDWFSPYVLSWSLSTSMEYHFCLEALQEAFQKGKPDTFNTDQIPQFTCEAFTGTLEAEGIRISMDGRGRAMDNIMIQRLWRSVKYEEVYLKDYESVADARSGLRQYFRFYNGERLHQSWATGRPKRSTTDRGLPCLPSDRGLESLSLYTEA
jgi:putative transposase